MNAETGYAFAHMGSKESPLAAAGRGADIFSLFTSAYARERALAVQSLGDT